MPVETQEQSEIVRGVEDIRIEDLLWNHKTGTASPQPAVDAELFSAMLPLVVEVQDCGGAEPVRSRTILSGTALRRRQVQGPGN